MHVRRLIVCTHQRRNADAQAAREHRGTEHRGHAHLRLAGFGHGRIGDVVSDGISPRQKGHPQHAVACVQPTNVSSRIHIQMFNANVSHSIRQQKHTQQRDAQQRDAQQGDAQQRDAQHRYTTGIQACMSFVVPTYLAESKSVR